MKELDALISEIGAKEAVLRNPTPFFAERQETYHAAAATVARRVIRSMRPPDSDQREWSRRAETVVKRIVSELMLGGGLFISVTDPANEASKGEPGGNPANPTRDDILEWVRAGMRGDAGGKRITPEDRKRIAEYGEKAVANIVRRAFYSDRNSPSYNRLRRAIHSYLSGAGDTAADGILEAVLTAWEAHFATRLHRDATLWAEKIFNQ